MVSMTGSIARNDLRQLLALELTRDRSCKVKLMFLTCFSMTDFLKLKQNLMLY
jgi:hypothetical protein